MSPAAIMRKPRVYCLYDVDSSVVEYAEKHFEFICPPSAQVDEWRDDPLAEAIMVRGNGVLAADVKRLSDNFKYVGKHGVGTDAIAVKELNARGIVVMNTPGVNASAVAELALTLSLAIARNVPWIDRRIRSGEIVTKADGGKLGFQLTGKTLGLIGGGNIGYQLGKMFYGAFQSRVLVYDPHLSLEMLDKWTKLLPSTHFTRVNNLDELLPSSDVVSVHVPLLDSTRDLLGEKELQKMKRSAILINTARGGIVNEDALVKALENGWIVGAGVDAHALEPPTVENYNKLISHPRVITTPHIGAASLDVITMTAFAVLEHLVDAFNGKGLRDVVTA